MRKLYSYKMVQQELIAYSTQRGTFASVGEVFPIIDTFVLAKDDQSLPVPSLYDWDLEDPRELLELYDPLQLDPGIVATDISYQISERVHRVPVRADIFVFLHFSHHKTELRKKDVIEFCYVLHGGAKLHQEQEVHLLNAGDFALIGPENIHDIVAEPGSVVLGIQIPSQRLPQQLHRFMQQSNVLVHMLSNLLFEDKSNFYVLFVPLDVEIKRVIRAMLSEFIPREARPTAICTSYFEILLYKILQSCEETDEIDSRSREQLFSAAMNEIYQQRSVSLGQLSERFHYSESYMSRLIRKKTGYTFNELVAEVRFNRAVELLEQTSMSMTEIANRAGYPSQNQFSRSFRSKTGKTPSEYRLKCQKKNK